MNGRKYSGSLKPLQNLIFSIVVKNKFLKFQLVIFLKFVNLGVLQRFQPEKIGLKKNTRHFRMCHVLSRLNKIDGQNSRP